MRVEPLRIITGDPGRRLVKVRGLEPRTLLVRDRRRCEARAVGEAGDRPGVERVAVPMTKAAEALRRKVS
jgi:hypothetical protein